jgi:translocator protein
MSNRWKFMLCLCSTILTGVIGTVLMKGAINGWYQYLTKPSFTPPAWLFGPVWTILYLVIGYAAYRVYKNKTLSAIKVPAFIFMIQLFLNAAWTLVFFKFQSIFGGLIVILFLWLSILGLIRAFAKESKAAAMLLIPYFLWVSFAAVLNFSIWRLNP